jgi:hypothetical protein
MIRNSLQKTMVSLPDELARQFLGNSSTDSSETPGARSGLRYRLFTPLLLRQGRQGKDQRRCQY